MAAPSSLTARMAAAVQATKGTAMTTGFLTGLLTRSYMRPMFETLPENAEHGGAATTRPTVKKSAGFRTGYVHEWGGAGRLYPVFVGMLLRGAGFGATSVNNTTHRTHTFTIAARELAAWLSVMHRLGEGGEQFERKARDARVSRLTLAAARDGLTLDWEGMALFEAQSVGTETTAAETNIPFIPNDGVLTLTVGGTNIVTGCKRNEMVIENPLSRDDFWLFAFGNADLPQEGLSIRGTIGDVDLSYDLYRRLNWGGVAGTGVSADAVTGALSYTYESAANISGAAVPYSLTVSVPTAEIKPLAGFEAQDRNLVRVGLDWEMVDTGSTPITITLVNGQTAY